MMVSCLMVACTDHVIPEDVLPTIQTLPLTHPGSENEDFENFHVAFAELGNQTVSEYGIVMKASAVNDMTDPTIAHFKQIFSSPVVAGILSEQVPNDHIPVFIGSYRFSYRAYAITSAGAIIYGNTISIVYEQL